MSYLRGMKYVLYSDNYLTKRRHVNAIGRIQASNIIFVILTQEAEAERLLGVKGQPGLE